MSPLYAILNEATGQVDQYVEGTKADARKVAESVEEGGLPKHEGKRVSLKVEKAEPYEAPVVSPELMEGA